ncbi:MAG: D-alanine--D-alanine ligase [Deltaproteobacteria bacterium]|nr:D-alanine--D-alanine ligase [Deltaproteobacteria bacterium]
MQIGIAYDLRSSMAVPAGAPSDRLEEYDSEETIDAIAAAIEAAGHQPRRLGGGRSFVEAVLRQPPDLVFNIAEGSGTRSREAQVPAVCEMLGIRYTHSDPLTLAVSLDKAMTKRLVDAAGVPTPRHQVIRTLDQLSRLELPFPVMCKPLFEGSSMGIRRDSRASDAGELRGQVAKLLGDYRQPVLVEEFCPGAELTVGILVRQGVPTAIGVMEIAPRQGDPGSFVYSLEVKRNYLEEVEYRVPPRLPPELVQRAERVALDAFDALDCRDVARVDLRLGADGEPKFIEVNPLPGVSPVTSDLVILAGKVGLGYRQLIAGIVDSARARYGI